MSTLRIPGGGGRGRPKSPRSGHNPASVAVAASSASGALRLDAAIQRAKTDAATAPPGPLDASRARVLEAKRCAVEGARLVNLGRLAPAIALLKRSVDLDPRIAASHHDLGLALLRSGRLEQAQEPFAAAARLDPGLASAHHNLAYVLDGLGCEGQALASYEAAVGLQPDLAIAQ